ncbi:MAG TPA: hypothetical protein VGL84_03900 [Gaiellaceae bacterium]|jgi:hypothetical protein
MTTFETDIKPLFRQADRDAMKWAFDLWSEDDVRANADAILERIEDGSMPCDGEWPVEQTEQFRAWVSAG